MEYNISHKNSNIDSSNNYRKNYDKEYKDYVSTKKNNKHKNLNNIAFLQNKINELEIKLQFYKKYENNLSNSDLNIINKSVEIIDQLINCLDKNIITKGQVAKNCKQIEFEF